MGASGREEVAGVRSLGVDHCRARSVGELVSMIHRLDCYVKGSRREVEAHDLANFALTSRTFEVLSIFVPFVFTVVAENDLSVS